jgi:hypothetical protein
LNDLARVVDEMNDECKFASIGQFGEVQTSLLMTDKEALMMKEKVAQQLGTTFQKAHSEETALFQKAQGKAMNIKHRRALLLIACLANAHEEDVHFTQSAPKKLKEGLQMMQDSRVIVQELEKALRNLQDL